MKNLQSELIKLAMQAEMEGYNTFTMIGVCDKLKRLEKKYGYDEVWEFLRTTRGCPFRLYAEFTMKLPSFDRFKLSYTI